MNTFKMRLSADLNGVPFRLTGSGNRSDTEGLVDGLYALAREDGQTSDISGLDHWVFNCLVVTGYPSETACPNGEFNPFRARPYNYERAISFFDRGSIKLRTEVRFEANGDLDSNFKAHGHINVPELVSVEPCVETWIPTGPKTVLGTFSMVWKTKNADYVPCTATTRYRLEGEGSNLDHVAHRLIAIHAQGTQASFTRYQRSQMLDRRLFQLTKIH